MHGFIASAVVLPADFRGLGAARFLDGQGRCAVIRTGILAGLERVVAALGDWRLVYPLLA